MPDSDWWRLTKVADSVASSHRPVQPDSDGHDAGTFSPTVVTTHGTMELRLWPPSRTVPSRPGKGPTDAQGNMPGPATPVTRLQLPDSDRWRFDHGSRQRRLQSPPS